MFEQFVQDTSVFIRDHQAWAVPIVLALAFCESIAVLSLLVPATVILLGVGALIGSTGIAFWPVWAAAVTGAVLGDWVSYAIGLHFKEGVGQVWPLSRYPDLLPRGRAFFDRWGTAGVFFGRFFGPLRATVPLAAGVCGMATLPFQLANVASAMIWAALMLGPGVLGTRWLPDWL